jgi:hypothetical protein
VLEGEQSEHAKPLFAFAQSVKSRLDELNANAAGSVIQVQ